MFSAIEYAKRYEDAPQEQAINQLQNLVDASGLGQDGTFVVALLNGISSAETPLGAVLREIRKALAEAAAIRGLGQPWKGTFDAYVASLGEDDSYDTATFYMGCMGNGLSLDHEETVAGQPLVMATPLVLVRQPVIEERAKLSGILGDYYYETEGIEIGMGLFEVIAGLRAQKTYKGSLKLGILQYASSDRVARYDGVTVSNTFTNALDTGERPWYKGVSTKVLAGEPAAVAPNDAPRWGLPKLWADGQKLAGIAIKDTFVTHVVVEVAPNTFSKLFTCEWAFTVDYDATKPDAATAAYEVTGQRFESGEIVLTGNEPLAGKPEKVTK
ncbi:hypothetical protein ITP53_45355 [Nonomuraea sp. K274]|uniref:Uncharacterized protein n=1 Tax=Nonomuraea cypriaca TaxID=1187855 RepID=A0A931AKU7_9ACTN|nr:hypothetical protein [Nonomuraea cypriaca]MBF8192789.1 hypothetical protein [Nonomuraea cypriaca]